MSVRIRLRRMGAKKKPFYRVVVADSRSPRDGRFLDSIGTYDPRAETGGIDIDREKTLQWLEEGAMPTNSARSLLSQAGIWQEYRTGVRPEPRAEAPASKPAPAAPETAEVAPPVVESSAAAGTVAEEIPTEESPAVAETTAAEVSDAPAEEPAEAPAEEPEEQREE